MLARACGKTNVHNLEPEDLCALTVEASAMARVPLAGTNYIPGVSEERTLEEIKRLLERDTSRTRSTTCRRTESHCSEGAMSEHRLPGEPEKIVGSTPSTWRASRFPYQEDISLVEDVDLMAATPGPDLNWLEDVDAARGGGDAGGVRPLLELVHQDLLPDPRRDARTRSRARC